MKKVEVPFTSYSLKQKNYLLFVILIDLMSSFTSIIFAIPPVLAFLTYYKTSTFKDNYFQIYSHYLLFSSYIFLFLCSLLILILVFYMMFSNDYRYRRREEDYNDFIIYSLVFLIFNFVFVFWRLKVCEKFRDNLFEVAESDLEERLVNMEDFKSFKMNNLRKDNEVYEN